MVLSSADNGHDRDPIAQGASDIDIVLMVACAPRWTGIEYDSINPQLPCSGILPHCRDGQGDEGRSGKVHRCRPWTTLPSPGYGALLSVFTCVAPP